MTGEGWPPSQHCQGNFFKDHCQDENIKDMIFRYQRILTNIEDQDKNEDEAGGKKSYVPLGLQMFKV